MKIELSDGYVLMREKINHGLHTSYETEFYKDVRADADGRASMSPLNVNKAVEVLVLGLIQSIVKVDQKPVDFPADQEWKPSETFITPSAEWLNDLDENDFKEVEIAALEIKAKYAARTKK